MKTDRNGRSYDEQLARYLGGEMDDAETRTFEAEISVSGEELFRIEELKKQWKAMDQYNPDRTPDTPRAWEKLYGRISEENLMPADQPTAKGRKFYTYATVAAAIVTLLVVGAIAYLNFRNGPAVEKVQLATGQDVRTLVKTLNDGSVVYLAGNTRFSFPKQFDSISRSVELKGEAFFDVAPDPSKPFIIETDEAVIRVVGTAFNVKTQNGHGFEIGRAHV